MLKIALIMALVGACVAAPNAIVDKRQATSSSSDSSDDGDGSSSDPNDGSNWYDYSGGSSYSSFDGYSLNDYSYYHYAHSSPNYGGNYYDNYHYDPTTYHTYEANEVPVTVRYPEKQEGGNGTSYDNYESVEFVIIPRPEEVSLQPLIVAIIPGMDSPNERRFDNETPSLIGWAHTKNDRCIYT